MSRSSLGLTPLAAAWQVQISNGECPLRAPRVSDSGHQIFRLLLLQVTTHFALSASSVKAHNTNMQPFHAKKLSGSATKRFAPTQNLPAASRFVNHFGALSLATTCRRSDAAARHRLPFSFLKLFPNASDFLQQISFLAMRLWHLLARGNPGTATIPQCRINKTKQHSHTLDWNTSLNILILFSAWIHQLVTVYLTMLRITWSCNQVILYQVILKDNCYHSKLTKLVNWIISPKPIKLENQAS